jgi:hypothetical protein
LCLQFGVSHSLWSILGLLFDFVGVVILGIDLVRLQRNTTRTAQRNLNVYKDLGEQFGGIESWADELEKSARHWISQSSYWDHHSEDEVSYNARDTRQIAADVANAASGLATYVYKLTETARQRAEEDARLSTGSLRFSVVGLILVAIGFAMQAIGALPC